MSDEGMLTEAEVRRVVRLLAEALSPDDGRAAKCRRVAEGLAALVDADGWIWFRSRAVPDEAPANVDFLMGGAFDSSALAEYADWSLEARGAPPENAPVKQLIAKGEHFTRGRTDLVPDAVWQSDRCQEHVRRMGLDAYVYSIYPLMEADGATVFSALLLLRRPGKPDFDRRACRLVHLVFSECDPLHRDGFRVELAGESAVLSPRLRSVQVLLLDGQSAKQIAQRLNLSLHTVNDYIKQVYRHFGAGSRTELMRRFMTSDLGGDA